MRAKFCCLVLLFVAIIGLCGVAEATLIIDTGSAENPATSGWAIFGSQWLAGGIDLAQAYTITDIDIWAYSDNAAGSVLVSVFGDAAGAPDVNAPLYSTAFSVDAFSTNYASWIGPSGLDWDLGPGFYWVAFSITEPGVYLTVPSPVPNPLEHYAFSSDFNGYKWYAASYLDWGLQVSGMPDGEGIVPEPASLTLCCLGLVGLAGRAYSRRKRS